MPLPDDASLYIPYEVYVTPTDPVQWVAVQKQGDDLIYVSPITWATREEAVLHCEDLNYLRMKAVESMMPTTLWVAVDVASDSADGVVVLERILRGQVAGWRLLNPATDEDNDAWLKAREMVRNALEAIAQEDLPFEDDESLEDHLVNRHGTDRDSFMRGGADWWVKQHREWHEHPGPDGSLDHTHEWNDEEVTDDASDAEEEGAHEDASSG